MDTQIFNFTDPHLSAETATQCDLSIVAGTDSAALLVSHPNGDWLKIQSWHFAENERLQPDLRDLLSTALHQSGIQQYAFPRVRWAWAHRNVTLVPRRLFNAEQQADYFKLLLPAGDYDYSYDDLAEFDCYLVHATPAGLGSFPKQYFPRAKAQHIATALLKNWRSRLTRAENEVFLNVRNKVGQIAVFDRYNLLYYNSFTFKHANDLLYFVLLAYDQFRLNELEVPLSISGNLLDASEGYQKLYRYIRRLRFIELSPKPTLPPGSEQLPEHCWFDLSCLL